jgi:sigma-B regulation protein RsbU (phosphoserine phosphatase)
MNRPPDIRAEPLALQVREILISVGGEPSGDPEAFALRVEEAAAELGKLGRDPRILAARLLARQVKDSRFELKERVLELESLRDLNLAAAGTLDLEKLADEILLRSISLTDSRSGALVLAGGDRPVLVRSFGGDLILPESVGAFEIPADGVINNDAAATPTCGISIKNCEKCLLIPIQLEGRRLGLLAVADKETREGAVGNFLSSDARLLSLFAHQAATALETARLHREVVEKERLEKELELAAAIQREILPRELPKVSGLSLFAATRPTRQVGGDYFDFFFPVAGARFGFVVADVSGKGVPAALLVSTLSAAIHLQIEEARDPGDLIARVHRHLYRFSGASKFSTVFLGFLDVGTGELAYVSAGHNPAILARSSGEVAELPATGRPLGMFRDSRWEVERAQLGPGDRLWVYTDGITEAQDVSQREFGGHRLQKLILEASGLPVDEATQHVLDSVARFAGQAPQYDDQTMLLLSRETPSAVD